MNVNMTDEEVELFVLRGRVMARFMGVAESLLLTSGLQTRELREYPALYKKLSKVTDEINVPAQNLIDVTANFLADFNEIREELDTLERLQG